MTETNVFSARHLAEAYQFLNRHGAQAKVLRRAGTDLMVLYNSGSALPAALLDIWRVDELRGISDEGAHLKIGALATYTEIISNAHTRAYAPALIAASRTIGAIQIQNRGTLGGNIANGSPAGDSLPVLARV